MHSDCWQALSFSMTYDKHGRVSAIALFRSVCFFTASKTTVPTNLCEKESTSTKSWGTPCSPQTRVAWIFEVVVSLQRGSWHLACKVEGPQNPQGWERHIRTMLVGSNNRTIQESQTGWFLPLLHLDEKYRNIHPQQSCNNPYLVRNMCRERYGFQYMPYWPFHVVFVDTRLTDVRLIRAIFHNLYGQG